MDKTTKHNLHTFQAHISIHIPQTILVIKSKNLYICLASIHFSLMIANEQTYQQIERALRKAASKFSPNDETKSLTDLYIQVKQESGELKIYDDDDNELTRCVIEEWIGNTDETFYSAICPILTQTIEKCKDITENVAILKPYSYVLMDEEGDTVTDLYLVDDENILISGKLMEHLNDDLDQFWEKLAKE